MTKKRGFSTQKLFSGLRMVSLVGPAAITIIGPGTPKRKGEIVMAKYTGIGPDGKFRLNDLRQGYEPFFWTSLATYGIPKIVNLIKGLFG